MTFFCIKIPDIFIRIYPSVTAKGLKLLRVEKMSHFICSDWIQTLEGTLEQKYAGASEKPERIAGVANDLTPGRWGQSTHSSPSGT